MCDESGRLSAEFLCEDGLVFDPISSQCGVPTTGSICPQPLKLQPPQQVGASVTSGSKLTYLSGGGLQAAERQVGGGGDLQRVHRLPEWPRTASHVSGELPPQFLLKLP